MDMPKGSQIDPKKILPENVSRKLMKQAESIIEVKGLNEMEATAITGALFLGAGIAMEER